MKQTPILMCDTSVRGILTCDKCGKISVPFPCEHCGSREFRKTQTRRIAKGDDPQWSFRPRPDSNPHDVATWDKISPYGGPGDLLLPREAWRAPRQYDTFRPIQIPADAPIQYAADEYIQYAAGSRATGKFEWGKWRPSIFMLDEHRRLWLAITEVRAQRLIEISNEDAWAEGCVAYPDREYWANDPCGPVVLADTPRDEYSGLWNSLNAAPKPSKRNPYTLEREDCYVSYPWEDVRKVEDRRGKKHYIVGNPFVFPISFSRTQKP